MVIASTGQVPSDTWRRCRLSICLLLADAIAISIAQFAGYGAYCVISWRPTSPWIGSVAVFALAVGLLLLLLSVWGAYRLSVRASYVTRPAAIVISSVCAFVVMNILIVRSSSPAVTPGNWLTRAIALAQGADDTLRVKLLCGYIASAAVLVLLRFCVQKRWPALRQGMHPMVLDVENDDVWTPPRQL